MSNLAAAYQSRIEAGDLRPDAAQEAALAVLQALAVALRGYAPAPRQRFFSRLFWGAAAPPRGLYLYGDVGRGKSMLMDLFFAEVSVAKKRRVHFHQFMLEIQARLHRLESEEAPDILPRVAREIAREASLLCFDEFHVGNIADAMILGRLFQALFDAGVVVVSTSNWAPDQLYKNGLQRERFLPFITLIERRMRVYKLEGAIDHRREQTREVPHYFHPLNGNSTRTLQEIFFRLTGNAEPEPMALPVQGRVLRITHASKGVGFFNFDELCRTALGPADYLEIARCLHTVLIDGTPVFQGERRDEMTRFVNLIDALYEAKVKLYMAAADMPERLAPDGDMAFPFQRTLSRLMEMEGEAYCAIAHLGG